MSGRKKKGNPDLNVVSFCDIVTVSMVAMFMALIIVIDQALRTPEIRPTPLATPTTNTPVFFECRNNQVYVIDRRELMDELQRSTRELRKKNTGQADAFLQEAMEQDIGNRFYRMDIGFLMMGVVALLPRDKVEGVPEENLDHPTNAYERTMTQLDTNSQYVVYLVRDDSFPIFRKLRDQTLHRGFLSGWEYLGRTEPITFEGMFSRVRAE
jgi:biopolymer transport protein ExbD